MTNLFTLMLICTTLITGCLWCLDKLFFSKQWKKHQAIERIVFNKNRTLKKKSFPLSWIEIGASFFPILIIVLMVRSFVYEPFQIPSGSMMPTLLIGDFILVEKFIYGIKDPIFQKTLIKISKPKRGDIVVFKYPKNPNLYYIKRVVGLPKDKISYNPISKQISIQLDCISNTNCSDILPITYSHIELSDFFQSMTCNHDNGIFDNFLNFSNFKNKKNGFRFLKSQETLGSINHYILTMPIVSDKVSLYYRQQGQPIATWIVPPGYYFVMGDNRDNSDDSRYWGFVPEQNLIGKAKIIWMSFGKQNNQCPIGIRLNRIGQIN